MWNQVEHRAQVAVLSSVGEAVNGSSEQQHRRIDEEAEQMKVVDAGAAGREAPDTEEVSEEVWAKRSCARLRQVQIGKGRPEYEYYLVNVPKWERDENHPVTPDHNLRISKRAFDRQLSNWRRQLHDFDQQHRPADGEACDAGCTPLKPIGFSIQGTPPDQIGTLVHGSRKGSPGTESTRAESDFTSPLPIGPLVASTHPGSNDGGQPNRSLSLAELLPPAPTLASAGVLSPSVQPAQVRSSASAQPSQVLPAKLAEPIEDTQPSITSAHNSVGGCGVACFPVPGAPVHPMMQQQASAPQLRPAMPVPWLGTDTAIASPSVSNAATFVPGLSAANAAANSVRMIPPSVHVAPPGGTSPGAGMAMAMGMPNAAAQLPQGTWMAMAFAHHMAAAAGQQQAMAAAASQAVQGYQQCMSGGVAFPQSVSSQAQSLATSMAQQHSPNPQAWCGGTPPCVGRGRPESVDMLPESGDRSQALIGNAVDTTLDPRTPRENAATLVSASSDTIGPLQSDTAPTTPPNKRTTALGSGSDQNHATSPNNFCSPSAWQHVGTPSPQQTRSWHTPACGAAVACSAGTPALSGCSAGTPIVSGGQFVTNATPGRCLLPDPFNGSTLEASVQSASVLHHQAPFVRMSPATPVHRLPSFYPPTPVGTGPNGGTVVAAGVQCLAVGTPTMPYAASPGLFPLPRLSSYVVTPAPPLPGVAGVNGTPILHAPRHPSGATPGPKPGSSDAIVERSDRMPQQDHFEAWQRNEC